MIRFTSLMIYLLIPKCKKVIEIKIILEPVIVTI